jgi:hypothetical protein
VRGDLEGNSWDSDGFGVVDLGVMEVFGRFLGNLG